MNKPKAKETKLGYACPKCDKSFPSEGGFNVHWGRVHGPNRLSKRTVKVDKVSKLPVKEKAVQLNWPRCCPGCGMNLERIAVAMSMK